MESHLIEIIDRLSRIEAVGKSTLAQAEKTNGRVNEIENRVDSLELTRAENKGSLKSAGAIGGMIATLGYFILNKLWR